MKNSKVCLLLMTTFLLMGCNNANKQPSESKSDETSTSQSESGSSSSSSSQGGSGYDNQLGPAPTYDEDSISIHYHREDGAYTNRWDLWMWDLKDNDGAAYIFNGIDDFGAVAAYPLSTWSDAMTDGVGIIIRSFGAWSKQTPDIKINLTDYQKDDHGIYNFYFEQGDNDIYDGNIYTSPNTEGISSAEFTNETNIRVKGSKEMSKVVLKEDGVAIVTKNLEEPAKTASLTMPADKVASFDCSYMVEVTFAASGAVKTKGVSVNKLYNTDSFKNNYTYEGNDLGAIRSDSSTTFKVWSPVSSEIKLRIYNSGTPKSIDSATGDDTYQEVSMIRGEKGVWAATINEDLAGKYYTYVVTNSTFNGVEIVDPYAKSAGINGLRGMIVNFEETDPSGWDQVDYLTYNRNELTVYETHVADVTSGNSWTGSAANKRKFLGLIEEGTSLTRGGKTVATGFDHIKEFGVNAVQLLPIFDQANNETTYSFNWGYNPLNYNVVEGLYSSNPYDGYKRINELKQVVQAYHEAGIEIIMDVVYNHVNGASGSNFDVLMPGYYYRYTSAGALTNGSGCGNETASEMPMMRKFMIDSTAFWMKEYKLDGFRFDLMGLHDVTTMNQLVANLKTINEHAVVYGEPWAGGTSGMPNYETESAKQSNGNKYVGYGQFNDMMRDALIKGGLNDKSAKGWVTNKTSVNNGDVNAIKKGIAGSTYASSYEIADPNKTVNYVTCHDNYTIYDRVQAANAADTEAEVAKMAMLAEAVVFTSGGTAFMQGGEEFLRTKGLDHNSYESGDGVNQFKYNQLISYEGIDMATYYENFKKLIEIKQTIAELHADTCNITVTALDNGSTLKYEIGDYVIIHSNGVGTKGAINLGSSYEVVLDTLGVNAVGASIANVTPQAYQSLVLRK